ncbi:MAG: Dabb family protein [Pyrinomonadaceae bacterium]
MLTHIVIWKYLADTTDEMRADHIDRLRNLKNIIPQVQSLMVGFDILHLPRSYDLGLVALFEDHAALAAYSDHPEHVKAASFGKTISEQIASVDFVS